jgi:hypothetical protein
MGTTYKVLGQQATAQSSLSVTNKALTNNVATLTTSAAHNLVVGQSVSIIMTTPDAAFEGVRVVTSAPTSTTFTFGSVNSNVTSVAATGTATGFTWYTLYTCPSNTSAVLSSLVVTNRGTTGGYYQIAISDSASAVANKDIIVYNDLAAASETIGLSLGITLDSTVKYLRVSASNANFTFNAFGMEITA